MKVSQAKIFVLADLTLLLSIPAPSARTFSCYHRGLADRLGSRAFVPGVSSLGYHPQWL